MLVVESPDAFAVYADLETVPSALAAARDGIDALLRDRGHRRTTPALTSESLLRGAASSARLEGGTSTLDALRDGQGDEIAAAAARLNAGLLALVPVVSRSPLQAFARMHTLAAAGRVGEEQLGRPRPEPGLATGLQEIAAGLVAATRAPAVAVAALVHGQLATLAPFEQGNGLVARAAERLILVARGVDPTAMIVPEAGHEDLSTGYSAALAALSGGTADGHRAWLVHCAAALTRGVAHSPLR